MDLERYPLRMESPDLLFIRLIEECAEVQKAITKALRFGLSSFNPNDRADARNNARQISDELADVEQVARELKMRGLIP